MSTLTNGRYFLGILLLTLSLAANAQTPTVSIVPGGPVVCAGTQLTTVIANLDPPYTYQWSNGATTDSITLNQSAFIRVRVRGFAVGGTTQRQVTSSWTPYLVIPNPTASVTP